MKEALTVLSVTLLSEGSARCILCDKDRKETIEVQFGDGSFEGPMCEPCFKRARRLRLRVALAKNKEAKKS